MKKRLLLFVLVAIPFKSGIFSNAIFGLRRIMSCRGVAIPFKSGIFSNVFERGHLAETIVHEVAIPFKSGIFSNGKRDKGNDS